MHKHHRASRTRFPDNDCCLHAACVFLVFLSHGHCTLLSALVWQVILKCLLLQVLRLQQFFLQSDDKPNTLEFNFSSCIETLLREGVSSAFETTRVFCTEWPPMAVLIHNRMHQTFISEKAQFFPFYCKLSVKTTTLMHLSLM